MRVFTLVRSKVGDDEKIAKAAWKLLVKVVRQVVEWIAGLFQRVIHKIRSKRLASRKPDFVVEVFEDAHGTWNWVVVRGEDTLCGSMGTPFKDRHSAAEDAGNLLAEEHCVDFEYVEHVGKKPTKISG